MISLKMSTLSIILFLTASNFSILFRTIWLMVSQELLTKLSTLRNLLSKFSKFFTTMFQRNSWNKDAWKELRPAEEVMITLKLSSRELKTISLKLSQLLITIRSLAKSDTSTPLEPSQKSMLNPRLLSYHKLCSCLDQKLLENLQLEPQWLPEPTWNLSISTISFNSMDLKAKMMKQLPLTSSRVSPKRPLQDWFLKTSLKTLSKLSSF